MFDIGMTELLVIGIVALIVVGPKDLPGMFRTLGRFTGKMKGMAREFQRAMEDAADDAGVKDIGKDLKSYANPKKFGLDKLNEAADSFERWDPMSEPSKRGSATKALSEERKAKADKIRDDAAERAKARREGGGSKTAPTRTDAATAAPGRTAVPDPAAPVAPEDPKT